MKGLSLKVGPEVLFYKMWRSISILSNKSLKYVYIFCAIAIFIAFFIAIF